MPVYDLFGNLIDVPYDVERNKLSQVYDIEKNPLLPTEPDIVVMTYNVQFFRGLNSNQAMQDEIISKYEPAIIGMQELGKTSTLPSVAVNMLKDYPYKEFSELNNRDLLVSKLALSNVVHAEFEHQDPEDMSTWGDTRGYIMADITVNGKTIKWINTHLCYLTQSIKWQQMEELFDLAEQYEYAILMGDFNSEPMDSAYSDDYVNMYKQFVDAGYELANNSPEAGFTNTWTESRTATSLADFTWPCDSIIVSSNIHILNKVFDLTKLEYLDGNPVDHIPVVAELVVH